MPHPQQLLRDGEPATFGQWVAAELNATNFWSRSCERSLRWSDPQLAIAWPLEQLVGSAPLLAEKDAAAPTLAQALAAGEVFA